MLSTVRQWMGWGVVLLSASACGTGLSPAGDETPDERVGDGASGAAGGAGVGGPAAPPVDCGTLRPGRAESHLLTRVQYDNTVRDLLGTTQRLGALFPSESTLLGFSNNASVHRVNLLLSEGHMAAAEQLAAERVARGVSSLLPCSAPSRPCVESFIGSFGLKAFRRPVTAAEAGALLSVYETASGEWGANKGLELLLQTFLQAPQFLYRSDGEATQGSSDTIPLDGYAVASRLSYFLWNTMPDEELFGLAAANGLSTREAVEAQARRMLADGRAQDTIRDFHGQWLGLSAFDGLARQVPGGGAPDALNQAWRESLLSFAQHAFGAGGGNVEALLTSQAVFLDATLAPVYGLPATMPGGGALDPTRTGLLAQPGLLALLSHPDQSAPVQRGVFVREQLLCQELPPPPPDVDASPPDPSPDATTRERFAEHSANGRCASCHRLLDPIGFGFEGFDHLGRVRTVENGRPIDTSGEVVSVSEEGLAGEFNGVAELSVRLAQSREVQDCVATQWFRYAMGRAELPEDSCSLAQVQAAFSAAGGSFEELLVRLATADVFRFRLRGDQDAL